MRRSKKNHGPYRSGLEVKVAALLPYVEYETHKIKYVVPASTHTYTPDFVLGPNDYLEVKGYLDASSRKKMILVRDQNPNVRIRFFFDKSDNKIYKKSPTSYADWCIKHNFEYTDIKKGLPKEWLD